MKRFKGMYIIQQLKVYRFLFWISFFLYFGSVIAYEHQLTPQSIIKTLLFLLPTLIILVVLDKIVIPKFYLQRRFIGFGFLLIGAIALAVVVEFLLEMLILSPHPFGKRFKLYENVVIISPWIIVGVIIFIIETNYRKTIENTRAELNYLKQQINPHFLLNTHNNIFFLINSDPTLAASMLLKLSTIMRYTLYECGEDAVFIEKEIDIMEDYIELEKIRKEDNFMINTDFRVEANRYKIAPLILITFLENAFKHVSNFSDATNSITTALKVENDHLIFYVSNTLAHTEQNNNKGIGLENVKKRLALLYPKKYHLDISHDDKMFTVNLTIKL